MPCDWNRETRTSCDKTAGMIEGKRSREIQREKMLDGLTKWLKVGRVIEALKVTRDEIEICGIVIVCAKEHGT